MGCSVRLRGIYVGDLELLRRERSCAGLLGGHDGGLLSLVGRRSAAPCGLLGPGLRAILGYTYFIGVFCGEAATLYLVVRGIVGGGVCWSLHVSSQCLSTRIGRSRSEARATVGRGVSATRG